MLASIQFMKFSTFPCQPNMIVILSVILFCVSLCYPKVSVYPVYLGSVPSSVFGRIYTVFFITLCPFCTCVMVYGVEISLLTVLALISSLILHLQFLSSLY
jgi:hypothetical protein